MVKRIRDNGKKRALWLECAAFMIMTALSFSACASPLAQGGGTEGTPEPERVDTGFVVTGPDSYDSADTAVLTGRDEKENTVTFLNPEIGRSYTLSMDGTTRLYDKYGGAVSIDQIEKGDIVDITFLKSKKHLTTMQLSTKSWISSDVEKYEMNTVRGEVSIGSETYKLTSNTQYLSEGRKIELIDLNMADVLSFQGLDNQILSVRVEKGHGYLRLTNDENFVGGWIEIGQTIIRRITEDMLLLVPEGSYEVNISNKGGGGIKSVVIRRNEETTLDIGDLEVPEPQTGLVLFSLTPSETELYIDGSQVDASAPVVLEYGLHQMIARAEGYQSITQYIRVAQESLSYEVVLEPAADGEEEESSSGTSSSTDTATTTDYYKVYVDAPEGAEVYLDGNYVGVSPCSFKKVEGSHVITLRMAGHETRSYTVQVDDEEKDLTFSFADLARYATETPEPTGSPEPTRSPEPTKSPEPTESPGPTRSPEPTETPSGDSTPTPGPDSTESPAPTPTPNPISSSAGSPQRCNFMSLYGKCLDKPMKTRYIYV